MYYFTRILSVLWQYYGARYLLTYWCGSSCLTCCISVQDLISKWNGSPAMTSIFKKLMLTRKASYKLSESLNMKVPFKLIIKPFKNKEVECIWSSFSYLLSMINRVPWTKPLNSKSCGCEVKQCHLVWRRNSCKGTPSSITLNNLHQRTETTVTIV